MDIIDCHSKTQTVLNYLLKKGYGISEISQTDQIKHCFLDRPIQMTDLKELISEMKLVTEDHDNNLIVTGSNDIIIFTQGTNIYERLEYKLRNISLTKINLFIPLVYVLFLSTTTLSLFSHFQHNNLIGHIFPSISTITGLSLFGYIKLFAFLGINVLVVLYGSAYIYDLHKRLNIQGALQFAIRLFLPLFVFLGFSSSVILIIPGLFSFLVLVILTFLIYTLWLKRHGIFSLHDCALLLMLIMGIFILEYIDFKLSNIFNFPIFIDDNLSPILWVVAILLAMFAPLATQHNRKEWIHNQESKTLSFILFVCLLPIAILVASIFSYSALKEAGAIERQQIITLNTSIQDEAFRSTFNIEKEPKLPWKIKGWVVYQDHDNLALAKSKQANVIFIFKRYPYELIDTVHRKTSKS